WCSHFMSPPFKGSGTPGEPGADRAPRARIRVGGLPPPEIRQGEPDLFRAGVARIPEIDASGKRTETALQSDVHRHRIADRETVRVVEVASRERVRDRFGAHSGGKRNGEPAAHDLPRDVLELLARVRAIQGFDARPAS